MYPKTHLCKYGPLFSLPEASTVSHLGISSKLCESIQHTPTTKANVRLHTKWFAIVFPTSQGMNRENPPQTFLLLTAA